MVQVITCISEPYWISFLIFLKPLLFGTIFLKLSSLIRPFVVQASNLAWASIWLGIDSLIYAN